MSLLIADEDSEDCKQQELLNKISFILHEINSSNEQALTADFISYEVHKSPALDKVVSLIFNFAVERPQSCAVYARLCSAQTASELSCGPVDGIHTVSKFREALLKFAHNVFDTRLIEVEVQKETASDMNEERREEVRKEKTYDFRRRMFGNIRFLGHLYLVNIMALGIIDYAVFNLLKTVTTGSLREGFHPDQESIECAVELLENIGSRLNAMEANRDCSPGQPPYFQMDHAFALLNGALPLVGEQLRAKINKLIELRENDWIVTEADSESIDQTSGELKNLKAQNVRLVSAVGEMQVAMNDMRRAMAGLEAKNKEILDLIERQGE